MKRPFITVLGVFIVVVAVGLVLTSLVSSRKFKFNQSAETFHAELVKSDYFISPQKARELIAEKNENYIFVDIRNPHDYENFHIESAVNVPMQRALDDEYVPYLEDNRIKVLYSQESIKADQIRLLLTQYGYENIMVLHGGASYWKANMLKDDILKSKPEYEDEKLKFDLTKVKTSK